MSLQEGHIKLPLSSQKSNALTKKFFAQSLSPDIKAVSDLEFLRNLSEQQRLTFDFGSLIASTGNMITITPQTGTTFYFFASIVANQTGASKVYAIFNDGIVRERVELSGDVSHEFALPFDRLVGDGIKSFTLDSETATTTANATVWGWLENTQKIG